jgi:hypothetical protein
MLGGCAGPIRFPAIIVNESNSTATVFVSMRRREAETGHYAKCRLEQDREPLKIGPAIQAYKHEFRVWPPVALDTFDSATCNAKFRIPAGQGVRVFWAPVKGEESSFPVVDRLEISNEQGLSISLSDRAAMDAFKWSRKYRDRRLIIE